MKDSLRSRLDQVSDRYEEIGLLCDVAWEGINQATA